MAAVTITNGGLNAVRDALAGLITYVAVGTGTAAPAATDTQLGNETFRKAVTSTGNGTNPGEGLFTMSLSPQDAVGVAITEVGWFAGGSLTANSGTLIARVLYSHTHTNLENVNLNLDSTV